MFKAIIFFLSGTDKQYSDRCLYVKRTLANDQQKTVEIKAEKKLFCLVRPWSSAISRTDFRNKATKPS